MTFTLRFAILMAMAATSSAWLFDSMRHRPMVVYSPTQSLLEEADALFDRALAQVNAKANNSVQQATTLSSPRYEITNNESLFQIAVDLPGVKMEDIQVSLEQPPRGPRRMMMGSSPTILSIRGHREAKNDQYSFASQFAQSFSLDPTVDVDNFKAHLENGVLIVSAPKNLKEVEETVRHIPITASPTAAAQDKIAGVVDEEDDAATTTAMEEKKITKVTGETAETENAKNFQEA